MKKGKMITAAVLAATMLMGAGYAAWTSSVNINHNITTGTMDVQFIAPHWKLPEVSADSYIKPTVTRTEHDVTFTLDNLYPGSKYETLTEEKNTGSIPVTFDKAVVTFPDMKTNSNKGLTASDGKDPLATLIDNTTVSFNCLVFDKNGNYVSDIHLPFQSNVKLSKLDTALNAALAGVRLEPGEYLTLQGNSVDQLMTFRLGDGEAVGNYTQGTKLNFTIQLNWKQVNVG